MNSFSHLEEAIRLQVQEILLCGAIGEQVQAYYGSTSFEQNIMSAHQKTTKALWRHYDVVDFRGQGSSARLLLSRHT